MNILFTCAGRRNYLINYFKESLNGKGKVVAADNQLTAPSLVDADIAVIVPRITDPKYIEALETIVKDYQIDAIISLNDLELPILAKNKLKLETLGTKVIISNDNIVDIAFDKWKTFLFFKALAIKTPKTYLTIGDVLEAINNKELQYPLIIKPRWGSASIGIDIAENEEELLLCYKLQHIKILKSILNEASAADRERSIIIQEKINGDEYGVDILNDLKGNYYGTFVRKKLAMRSGETDKAISVIDEEFTALGALIGRNSGHVGNMDCDFFVADGEVYFLEMNPRFGGGYPFSHEAGINTTSIYVSWLSDDFDVDKYNNFKADMMFSKCDRIIKIDIK
ncbi:ATP-grasp domain-containing protein [Mariniflexile gromovii]|uniref:ATP-grasp domain-containing protein n=1 Tax=Mariniflexile gromovii TaxID=362523 RepID=A0ABS4BQY5_9FLAO|nr:ATP-grasp domain-containing protein [Mariniflexile gromovii]MBP0902485.1 ATP-grasp domain-containing protein [Mariniflexile gromovii]